VELLTIGVFARASRLSPKALRLYDSLGLLMPAHVDEVSGYRFYRPDQLERARLVAWLRRLGMPLARIGTVCDLAADAPDQAARQIAAYWAETEAELAGRRALAAHLVSYLSGEETTMQSAHPLAIRYAARSDIGRRRDRNQDTAYASRRLLAVADGMGASGDAASAAVIEALKPLEAALPAGNLLNAMADAVRQAGPALRELADADPGTGTTLTAMLWSGSQLALVHVGDTRAYLLRAGELFQITHDHSVVQALLDEGKITPEEADSHPQRSLLLRAIDGRAAAEPDVSLHDARAGDRYLLCSDGLTAVVSAGILRDTLDAPCDPEQAVERLIVLANEAGGPDNIACVVADVIEPPHLVRKGWTGATRRSAGPGREPGRVGPAVSTHLRDAERDGEQHGTPRPGHPDRPRVDHRSGGGAGQAPDHDVHQHDRAPDRPQHPERRGQSGEPRPPHQGGRRRRCACGCHGRVAQRHRTALRQVGVQRGEVAVGHGLGRQPHPLQVLVHFQAALVQGGAQPLHDLLPIGV
jgi:PPM family protein phosphatase